MASLHSLNPIFDNDLPLALPPSPPATDEDRVNAMEEEVLRETEYYSGLYDSLQKEDADADAADADAGAEEEEEDADDEQEDEEQEDESTLHEMEKNPMTTFSDTMMCTSFWVLIFTLFLAFLLHPAS